MGSPEDARRIVEYGNRRSVGGNTIKMSFVSIMELFKRDMLLIII